MIRIHVLAASWDPEDSLELGDARKSTGCEENNAHALLKDAGYTSTIATYIPFMQAYVGRDG